MLAPSLPLLSLCSHAKSGQHEESGEPGSPVSACTWIGEVHAAGHLGRRPSD